MHPDDPVLAAFLSRQYEEARALERQSTVMELAALNGSPPRRYVATFHARGLVQGDGDVQQADVARFGVWIPEGYLKDDIDLGTMPIVTYLGPHPRPFHPQILPFPPFAVCIHMTPGTPLTALLRAAYEVWCYQLVNTSDNGLNPRAASWARAHAGRFPVDPRPLTGRAGGVRIRKKQSPEREAMPAPMFRRSPGGVGLGTGGT